MTKVALPETPEEMDAAKKALYYSWELNGRVEQRPPMDKQWTTWLYLGGRGTGKTRSGAEWLRARVNENPGAVFHLVAPTSADVRDVMVEGVSGLLNVFVPEHRPIYVKSQRKLLFHNGAYALLFSADEPERLRGPQCHYMWMDEIASWRRPDAYDMAMFGLRLGNDPRCAITGTPKPTKIIKDLIKRSQEGKDKYKDVWITRGSMLANRANLPDTFIRQILRKYEGTRLGDQEIFAKVLSDNPNALWSLKNIEKYRYTGLLEDLELGQIIVSVDPSIRGRDDTDDCGIIVMGLGRYDNKVYILDDYTIAGPPKIWAKEVVRAFDKWQCGYVLYESNQGGEMVESTISAVRENIPMKDVFASKGKHARAEPVSMLYEQGRVIHVGVLPELEEELCEWDSRDGKAPSPNRLDAMVHGVIKITKYSSTTLAGGGNVRPRR